MPGPRSGLPVQYLAPYGNDMLNGKAEVREELIRGGRFTVAGHADDFAF